MSDLREELLDKKIIDYTDQELLEAGFIGDAAPECVKSAICSIKGNPKQLDFITGFEVDCMKKVASDSEKVSESLTSENPTLFSRVGISSNSALTVVDGQYVSDFERRNYYVGLCANDADVPLLYYRTSLKSTPFPMPTPGTKWFEIPNKTITDKVLDPRGIQYRSLGAVRFSTPDDAGKQTLGPIIIWIGTHRGTTSPDKAHDASPAILDILRDNGVIGAEVEWYE